VRPGGGGARGRGATRRRARRRIDRSATAVSQARAGGAAEIATGRLTVRQVAAEDFALEPGEAPFDIVFAVRVGALDGRHPEAGRRAWARIAAALAPGGRVFLDGREVATPSAASGSGSCSGRKR
jgi:hypothetical protein